MCAFLEDHAPLGLKESYRAAVSMNISSLRDGQTVRNTITSPLAFRKSMISERGRYIASSFRQMFCGKIKLICAQSY
jgi:hypothetical protein